MTISFQNSIFDNKRHILNTFDASLINVRIFLGVILLKFVVKSSLKLSISADYKL